MCIKLWDDECWSLYDSKEMRKIILNTNIIYNDICLARLRLVDKMTYFNTHTIFYKHYLSCLFLKIHFAEFFKHCGTLHFLHSFLILDFHLQRRGVDTPVFIHYTMGLATPISSNIELLKRSVTNEYKW